MLEASQASNCSKELDSWQTILGYRLDILFVPPYGLGMRRWGTSKIAGVLNFFTRLSTDKNMKTQGLKLAYGMH